MLKFYPMTRRAWISLAAIVLIAAILRLGDGGATTHFRYDHAQLSLLALQMAHGEQLPLLGIQSSAGVPNSPMTVYFLVPLFWLTSSPFLVTLFIALWNVFGVGLFWGLVYRYFGGTVALVGGLVYAVSPYAVRYSRSIWAQNYHTPFILAGIWLGLYGFLEGKRWAQVLCLPLLIVGFQIHFAAWTLLPIYLWLLWVGRRNIAWKAVTLSILLAIITLLPFAMGLANEPAGAVERAGRITSIIQDGIRLRWYPAQQVADLTTGSGLEEYLRDGGAIWLASLPPWSIAWQLLGVFALLGLVLVWLPQWRKFALLLYLWAGITLAAFIPIWTGSGVYHHYFIPTLPALALLIALGTVGTAELLWRVRPLVFAVYALLGTILITQAVSIWSLHRFAFNTYTISNDTGQTTTPMQYLMQVREALQPYDDVLILGANPHESNYYIWQPMLYDSAACVRDLLINGGGIDVLPAGAYAVLVAPLSPINANYEVPARYRHDNPLTISLRPGEDPYIIYGFDAAPAWTETPLVAVAAPRFENGIQLTGYYLSAEWLQLQWEVWRTPGSSYQYFAHFLDANGEKIGQQDAPFYVGQHWCAGDTLITTIPSNPPRGVATLRVGMYTLDADGGTTNQSVLDAEGQVSGTWVDITLDSP